MSVLELCDREIAAVPLDASVADAINKMLDHHVGAVAVVDAEFRVAGIFTERDVLMRVAGFAIDVEHTAVASYMAANPHALPADSSVAFAVNKMVVEEFRHIPLVDESDRPVGVVSMRDIIEYLADFFSRDVLNLPPKHAAALKRDGG